MGAEIDETDTGTPASSAHPQTSRRIAYIVSNDLVKVREPLTAFLVIFMRGIRSGFFTTAFEQKSLITRALTHQAL